MTNRLTIRQFERLDGALSAYLLADDAGAARAESRLYDVIIDLVGYARASEIPSLSEWAAERVTATLCAA